MQSNKVNCIAVDSASNVLVVDFFLPCAHATVHTGDHGAAGPPATRRRPVHFPPLKEVLYGVDLTEYNVAMSQGEKKVYPKTGAGDHRIQLQEWCQTFAAPSTAISPCVKAANTLHGVG